MGHLLAFAGALGLDEEALRALRSSTEVDAGEFFRVPRGKWERREREPRLPARSEGQGAEPVV